MLAALNTAEPPIVELESVTLLERDEPWFARRLPLVKGRVRDRLGDLSRRLGGNERHDGGFSAGDLMMVMVLRRLDGTGLVEERPNLAALVARGEARPACRRAFAAQRAVFEGRAGA